MTVYKGSDKYAGIDQVRSGATEILVASHTVLGNEKHFNNLRKIPWKLVIVDEHHKLKNPKAKVATNLRKMRDELCLPVIGLTGTIMQNNHEGVPSKSMRNDVGKICQFADKLAFLIHRASLFTRFGC